MEPVKNSFPAQQFHDQAVLPVSSVFVCFYSWMNAFFHHHPGQGAWGQAGPASVQASVPAQPV